MNANGKEIEVIDLVEDSSDEELEEVPSGKDDQVTSNSDASESEDESCSICLEKYVWKTRLACDHDFCFLCIKGALAVNKFCPLCRQPVSDSYNVAPFGQSARKELDTHIEQFQNTFLWYYESKANNWWMFERRDSIEIERQYQEDPNQKLELIISGRVYVIDFEESVQYPKDYPSRRRMIKRGRFDPDCRGIAGFRLNLRMFLDMDLPPINDD